MKQASVHSHNRTVLCVTFCYIFFCTGIPVVTETPTTEPLSPPAINGTTLLPTNGTTRSPTSGTIETAQPPTNETIQPPMKETSQPPTVDTTQPPAVNATQPPTEDTTQPPTVDTTQPPTEDTTQPPTVDTTQPPAVNTTQPPTVITTPHSTENTTQLPTGNTTEPPTEGPTSEEIDDEEYCEIFIERETDKLQTVARREGKNFTTEQLRDTVPEECHFLLDNDTTTQPTPSQQPVTGQFNSQPPTMGPSMGRKRRAQKWSAKSFWRDVSRKVGMRYQATVNPASVRFEVERGHVVTDKLDDVVFKEQSL